MAVEAVVAVVIQKVTHLLTRDSVAFHRVIDQVEVIRLQLRQKGRFFTSADADATKDYLRILFAFEDEIENYVLAAAVRNGFRLIGPRRSLRHKLRLVANDIMQLENKWPAIVDVDHETHTEADEGEYSFANDNDYNDIIISREIRFESPSPSPRSSRIRSRHQKRPTTVPAQQESTPIGFIEASNELVDRLMGMGTAAGGGGGGGGREVIPVVGAAGSGKTTLVQAVYSDKKIKRHFKCRAWVHVPQDTGGDITNQPPITQVLVSILQQVLQSKESGVVPNVLEQLKKRVFDSLQYKDRYLVVLDYVGNLKLWNQLETAFPELQDGAAGKVILIARDKQLAASVSSRPHHLDPLSDHHSWKLFTKKSCTEMEKTKLDDTLRPHVMQKCQGLPLDIVLLGGFFSKKRPICDEWKWHVSQPNWRRMDVKLLSYNDLPVHSKLCLLYMALFPNEVEISIRRLHRLWLAEGFVRPSPGMSEQDLVEDYFDDLVQRNFIKITKLRSDGSPRRCILPCAIREYLSPIAHEVSLFHVNPKQYEQKTSDLGIRRVVEYADINNYPSVSPAADPSSYEKVRSYISFKLQRNDTPAKEVGSFISQIIGSKGFGVLRVLDLEGVYKPTLPETLKHLFHLRYLGLRWTFIDYLPKSVGDLPYLETLDLKRTHVNSLPRSIWKLKQLKHLDLPDIHLDWHKKRHSCLRELQTLMGLIVDDDTPVKDSLSEMCKLRELGVTCQLSSFEDLMRWIQDLTNLRSLWLTSKDETGRPSKITLESLSGLSQLSRVSLLGNLEQPIDEKKFPTYLKVLSLSVSQLNEDPMRRLSKLQHLSVLRLLANSFLGTEMTCPKDGFKNLRVLKLWMLKELKEWTVEERGMPRLQELNIRCCSKLKRFPLQLLSQHTLTELTLTGMPDEFVAEVDFNDHDKVLNAEKKCEFTSLPWEKDRDLWEFGRREEA